MQNIRVAFMTLGCKVNYYETEKIKAEFKAAGARIVPFTEKADIYIVNTCTVTGIADRKSRKMLHRAKKLNKDALVVATGCFAEADKDNPGFDVCADIIIGNDRKDDTYSIVMEHYMPGVNLKNAEKKHDAAIPPVECRETGSGMNGRTRAYIKIQDGCNQFCSYCKIPYVRGRLKSRDTGGIIEEIRFLADCGYKEVVLTGIHLSSYGVEKSGCRSFVELKGVPLTELAAAAADIQGIERIRFGSLEPRIITDDFVAGLSENKKVCPHFHLSLQSGCDKILKSMNRHYTTDEYERACGLLRKYYDMPAITTDIIVGFPGEGDGEFEECLSYVRRIAFSDIHVFKYSPRKGTRAAGMGDRVGEDDKRKRSARLIECGRQMTRDYNLSFIGKEQVCLVEERAFIDGVECHLGHNERYIKLAFPVSGDDASLSGELVSVIPERITGDNILYCRTST